MTTAQDLLDPTVAAAATDSIPSVKEGLMQLRSIPVDQLINTMVDKTFHFTISLAVAIFVFYLGKFIIRKLYNFVAGIMIKRSIDRSLSTFILSLVRIVLYFILIVTAIGIIGIDTSSFIAIFASAGLAVGMALSGTLQNFAGGVLILLLKPYRIGDYIEAQGFSGTVTEIQIFHTIICTSDNKSIIIPNGGLSTGSINNWSREDYRRVEWNIGISYGDNVETARQLVLDMFAADSRIVKHTLDEDRKKRKAESQNEAPAVVDTDDYDNHSWLWRLFHKRHKSIKDKLEALRQEEELRFNALSPAVDRQPTVKLSALADSSVNLTIRAWVHSSDYWAVFYDFNEKFYTEFPRHGLSFPFPQMDVHVTSSSSEHNA